MFSLENCSLARHMHEGTSREGAEMDTLYIENGDTLSNEDRMIPGHI